VSQRLILHSAGPHALLAEFEDIHQVRNYYAEAQRRLSEHQLPAGIELVPAASTLLFDGIDDLAALARDLRTWRPLPACVGESRQLKLPTIYDGPDLPDVAELWDMTVSEVIQMHTDLVHEVAFIGFAPGFAYISGIPAALRVPRRSRPRPWVAAGSVALADQFTGVYPRQSPGGWQLIGRTTVPMWNPNSEPASYFMPGDRVRFVPITP
jgi:KipI family sensor histidine kinase inhibitor